jgi:lipopolysaccharide assembly outer membrane protein LptD (OstA)
MKSLRLLVPLAVAGASWCVRAGEPFPLLPGMTLSNLNASGFAEFSIDGKGGTMTGPFVLTYSNVVLRADSISVPNPEEYHASGHVSILQDGTAWYGEHVVWKPKTKELNADSFRAGYDPVYVYGEGLHYDAATQTYVATNAVITTDNVSDPAHEIGAKTLRIVPGEYIEVDGAKMVVGDVPVFYLPYYHRTMGRHPLNFSFLPGYRTRYGAFLESKFNYQLNEVVDGSLRFDMRSKRGFAGGPDVFLHLGEWGEVGLQYYYLADDKPGLDPALQPIHDKRDRLKFTYDATFMTNLTVKSQIRYQRDGYIVRDFFESEYKENVQPNSFVEVNQQWSNWALDAYAQPRVNDYFETVERLPDIRLTGLRQQLGDTPLYYDSESSFAYLQRSFANVSTNDFSASRADTFHQVTLPWTFFGWLNVTPRTGARYTYYTEADGPGASTSAQSRWVYHTGAEVSLKASRVWEDAANDILEVQGLRHIVEPSVNYVYVPDPSRSPNQLPQFDYEIPSLRLLPIEYPDYNAIDSIDSQNVLRLGLRNRLQTKRDGKVENLLAWNLVTDWRLDRRPGQSTFSDVFSDMDFQPRSWITLSSALRYSVEDGTFRESYHRLYLHPGDVWSLALGQRYFSDPATYGPGSGHNTYFSSLFYKLNENWAFRMSHHFEARDGTLEEQFYTLYRDFRSWTSALTFRVRDDRIGDKDYTVAVSFSLKAFPRFGLGEDTDRPERLLSN